MSNHDVRERFFQANGRMRYFSTITKSRDHYRDADVFLASENGTVSGRHFDRRTDEGSIGGMGRFFAVPFFFGVDARGFPSYFGGELKMRTPKWEMSVYA